MKGKKRTERLVQVLGFEAEPDLRDQIDRLATEQDRSRSWIIRDLLLRALAAQDKPA